MTDRFFFLVGNPTKSTAYSICLYTSRVDARKRTETNFTTRNNHLQQVELLVDIIDRAINDLTPKQRLCARSNPGFDEK